MVKYGNGGDGTELCSVHPGQSLLQSKTIRVTGGQPESALISFVKKESFYLLCAQLERASVPQKLEGTSTRRGG